MKVERVFSNSRILFVTLLVLLIPSLSAASEGETVCIQCHGVQSGRLMEPVKLWQESIHAENGISCHSCHGGDPLDAVNAMNPSRGFLGVPKEVAIPGFCGRCHIGIKADYLASAHGRALGQGGPTCVTCHGNHAVKKVTLDLINEKTCSACHSYERAKLIRTAMEQTESTLVALSVRLETYKGQGIDTSALEKSLFAQRNRYHSLFHEVNTARVKAESAAIAGELSRISSSLAGIDAEQNRRRTIGAFAIAAALLAALLLHLLKKTYV
jgi:hypothetical protein